MRFSVFVSTAFTAIFGLHEIAFARSGANTTERCVNASSKFSATEQTIACRELSSSEKVSAVERAKAFGSLARIHAEKRNYKLAISELDEAIKLNPIDPDNWGGRGLFRSLEGDDAAALPDFDEAIRLEPRADFFAARALLKFNLSDFKGANADAKQALKLDPALFSDPQWNKATFEKILAVDGHPPKGDLTDRCTNDSKLYTFDERVAACKTISRSEDTDSIIRGYAYALLGHAYVESFQWEKAISEFTEALKLNPSADTYVGRAGSYSMLGYTKQAISDFDEAIRLEPSAMTYFLRSALKFKIEDFDGAKADAEAALKLDASLANDPEYGPAIQRLIAEK